MSAADAIADSLAIAAAGGAGMRAFVEEWHDFFILAGTAAVTLAGLLFIALSLHMEALVQERFGGALAVARAALTSFILVMMVSIFMLTPRPPLRPVGFSLIAWALGWAIMSVRELRGATRHDHAEFTRRTVRRRVMMPIVGFAFVAIAGYGMLTRQPVLVYQIVGGIILLLVNAAYASWDLLVRIARAKASLRADGA